VKIFGREPVLWLDLAQTVLPTLVLFGVLHWSNEQVALVVAAFSAVLGVVTAYLTKNTGLGVVTGLVKAVLACAVGFGLDLGADQTAALLALTTVVFSFVQRGNTSPAVDPGFHDEAAKPVPVTESPVVA
jgi:hypothetical protein